jgi:hypothetical protein
MRRLWNKPVKTTFVGTPFSVGAGRLCGGLQPVKTTFLGILFCRRETPLWRTPACEDDILRHPFLQARDAFVADALGKLVLTSSGEAALATADLVVEAITENLPLKQEHRDHGLKFCLWKFTR